MRTTISSGVLILALAGALAAFAANDPDRPEKPVVNAMSMESVAARDPILASDGSKRVIVFHLPAKGGCSFHAIVWDESRATHRAGQIRVDLRPNQTMHIDRDKDQSLDLKCGADAKTLSVADGARELAFDARN